MVRWCCAHAEDGHKPTNHNLSARLAFLPNFRDSVLRCEHPIRMQSRGDLQYDVRSSTNCDNRSILLRKRMCSNLLTVFFLLIRSFYVRVRY